MVEARPAGTGFATAAGRGLRLVRIVRGCVIAWLVGSLLAPPLLYMMPGTNGVQGKSAMDLIAMWPFIALMAAILSSVWMLIFALPLALLAAPRLGNRRWHNALYGAVAGGGLVAVIDEATTVVWAQGTWPIAALYGAATGYFGTRCYHG